MCFVLVWFACKTKSSSPRWDRILIKCCGTCTMRYDILLLLFVSIYWFVTKCSELNQSKETAVYSLFPRHLEGQNSIYADLATCVSTCLYHHTILEVRLPQTSSLKLMLMFGTLFTNKSKKQKLASFLTCKRGFPVMDLVSLSSHFQTLSVSHSALTSLFFFSPPFLPLHSISLNT